MKKTIDVKEIDLPALGFDLGVSRMAHQMYDIVIVHPEFIGKAPSVIMSACVYLAGIVCGQHKSQEYVAKKFNRSGAALKTVYQHILDSKILVGRVDGIEGGGKMKFLEAVMELLKKKGIDLKEVSVNDIERLEFKDIEFRKTIFHLPKGIYFKCVRCGLCCRNDIPLDNDEVESGFFETKEGSEHSWSFTNKFIKKVYEDPCPYFKDGGCSIYDKRPTICRKYPMEHTPRSLGMKIKEYSFMVDKADTELACNGYHLGRTRPQHIKQFVSPLRKKQDKTLLDSQLKKHPEMLERYNKELERLGCKMVLKDDGELERVQL